MAQNPGRQPTCLKRILGLLNEKGYLTKDLVEALDAWEKGLREGKFSSNIAQTETLLRGLKNPEGLARLWIESNRTGVDPESEAGLRARLSDEMAWCQRRGGVILPDGKIREDVPAVVKQTIFEIKPELKTEVQREVKQTKEGRAPNIIEGNCTIS